MSLHYTDIQAHQDYETQAELDKVQSDFLKLYYHEKDKQRPRTLSELMALSDTKRKNKANFELAIFVGMCIVLPFTPLLISYLRGL